MRYFTSFVLSVVLTSLSYFFGSLFVHHPIAIYQALIIGISVVSIGAITEVLGAPVWLIVLIPFPVGMILLFLFLNQPLHIWLLTYLTILVMYTVIHIIMSYFFEFHSLIPAWKLS